VPRRLIPTALEVGDLRLTHTPTVGETYATLTLGRAVRLAGNMPDCQSAVLFILVWQATLHEKMKRGRLAGRPVASLSGSQLAGMTGRPLRTVRHALARLVAAGAIRIERMSAGCKNSYVIPFVADGNRRSGDCGSVEMNEGRDPERTRPAASGGRAGYRG
jgi:hypothetical protein